MHGVKRGNIVYGRRSRGRKNWTQKCVQFPRQKSAEKSETKKAPIFATKNASKIGGDFPRDAHASIALLRVTLDAIVLARQRHATEIGRVEVLALHRHDHAVHRPITDFGQARERTGHVSEKGAAAVGRERMAGGEDGGHGGVG
jgi:hypothetical protein